MTIAAKLEQYQIRERIFDVAWILLILALILNLTAWDGLDHSGQMEQVLRFMRIIAFVLFLAVALINLITRRYPLKWIFLYILLAIVFGLSWRFSKNTTLLYYFIVFAAAYRQDSRRLLTLAAIINGGIVFLNLLGSYLGFSENFLFGEGTRPRYGLGFSWVTSGAILFFFFILEYLVLRKRKMNWWEFLILEVVNLFFFLKTDSRMAFVLATAVLVFFFIKKIMHNRFRMLFRLKWLFIVLPAVFAMVALALSFIYQPATPGWSELDDLVSNRLYLGNKAIQAYDITLFGQPIQWVGFDINNLTKEGYNYVDCSYLQILLQYGVFSVFASVFIYCLGISRALKWKDAFLACAFVIIAFFSITEPRLMNLAFNVFPVLAFAKINRTPALYRKGMLKEIFTTRLEEEQTGYRLKTLKKSDYEYETPSIRFNFIMNTILSVSTFVFPLITFPYVSRVLGPHGTGTVDFAFSIVGYFCIFSQLGIPTYGIRAIAKVRDDKEERSKVAQELLIINLIMTVISYVLLFIAIAVVPKMREERTLFLIVGLTIILSAIGMEWLYKGMEQYRYITVRTLIFKLIAAVSMFLLLHSEEDYLIYGIIAVFSGSASFILNFINARKLISFKRLPHYDLKRHLKPAITFFALACATTVYTNLDAGMLGFMRDNTEVGYYNAAVKVKAIMLGIITSLGAVLLPRASYYVERGMEREFEYLGKKSLNFTFLLSAPIFIYFIIYAKEGIMTLAGSAYEGSILPMQIIMPTIFLIGITNILGFQILTPMDHENIVFWSVSAGAVLDIILNCILIPKLGASGAAIGTLAAELCVLIFQMVYLKTRIKVLFSDIKFVKIIIAIVIGVVLSLWIKVLPFSDLVLILISAVVFFGSYYAMLMIQKEPFVTDITHQTGRKLKELLRHTSQK